jgi:hypothetical protein
LYQSFITNKHANARNALYSSLEYKPEAFEIIAKKNACPILKAKNNHSYPVNVDIARDLSFKKHLC